MKTQRWMARVGVTLGIAVFGLVSTASGQECPEHVDSMSVNRWPSSPTRIEVSGSYAYLGGHSFVAIADVAHLGEARVVGQVEARAVVDFSVSGNRLFVLDSGCTGGKPRSWCWSYLNVTDVSDPERPEPLLVGHSLESPPRQIEVSDNTVFITSGDGLRVLDVADLSTTPFEVGFLNSPWEPSDLAVESGHAYVTVPDSGLRIIDVSDPTNPVEAGVLDTVWEAHDLEVSNGFAYVADGAGGLRVIDVTDSGNPTEVGILESDIDVMNVAVDGSLATVGLAHPGVLIVDVSDPANPSRKNMFITEGPAEDTALTGEVAFAVTGPSDSSGFGGFRVLDLSVPDQTIESASFDFQSSAMDVAVSNAVKYIANGDSGLYVVDGSDPDETIGEFLDTPGFAVGVTLHEQYALVADDHKGVRIIDVSDTKNLIEVGFVDTPGQARRVAVLGDYAYVADGDGGLRIIDFSNPKAPVEIGAINIPELAADVAVAGDYAYVADGHLRIIDVSDPTDPVAAGPSEQVFAKSVAIEDGLLYLAFSDFHVFDLSNPSEPQPMSRKYIGYEATDISVSGFHAYVATRRDSFGRPGGVDVFDILNPYFPSRVGRWKFDGDGWAVTISDDRAYLAGGQPGVVVLENGCLTTYWVEIVTHDDGFHGSQWRSDVVISHGADRRVGFDFILHTVDGDITAGASVDKGEQGVFEDIVGLLGYEGTGALEIQASHPIRITSRIYSETNPGTYGAFLQGHRSTDCFGGGALFGLRQVEGEFRTNISVTNTTDETREVWITLYRTDGQELVRYSVEVEPGMVVQDLQPFEDRAGQPNLGWGYATVEGGTGILACASVIDSRTNDALIVPLLQ